MDINQLLCEARLKKCSDVHLTDVKNPVLRLDGVLMETGYNLSYSEKADMIFQMLDNNGKRLAESGKDVDFCYTVKDFERYRVNVYHQRGKLCAAIRVINDETPSFDDLKLPNILRELAMKPRGLVLVTGPTGSGKSTTLAAMIDLINSTKVCHIITIEDPIEYAYKQKRSLIHQREVGVDVESFSGALRSAMREDPDVILVGEMRDYETVSAAITAAETGHLVFSTLHTTGAANTVDRIIDVFPSRSQQQIRTQLTGVLQGVVTQQLLPRASGKGRVPAFEIMTGTDAVLSLIRENKCHQLTSTMQTGGRFGMITMEDSLKKLLMQKEISAETAKIAGLKGGISDGFN